MRQGHGTGGEERLNICDGQYGVHSKSRDQFAGRNTHGESTCRSAFARAARFYAELERRMAEDKAEFDAKSEQVKEQLKREFPDLFTDPQSLPPLRHQNHRIELEEGAMLPKSRGLPRLSHTEMEETRRIIDDFVRKGWIEP